MRKGGIVTDDKISTLHRVLLWVSFITCIPFGLGYYLIPGLATSTLNVNAPDLISIACIGGFLIAASVGAVFSLRSGLWSEIRITTYYLLTWSLLNSIRMGLYSIIEKEASLLPNVILSFIIGIGLAYIAVRRKFCSKN